MSATQAIRDALKVHGVDRGIEEATTQEVLSSLDGIDKYTTDQCAERVQRQCDYIASILSMDHGRHMFLSEIHHLHTFLRDMGTL